jgi:hypothetical protein
MSKDQKEIDLHDEYKKQLSLFEFQERAILGRMLVSQQETRTALVEYNIRKQHFFFAHTRALFKAVEFVFNSGFPFTDYRIYKELIQSGGIYDLDGFQEIQNILETGKKAGYHGLTTAALCELLNGNIEFRNLYFLLTRYEPPEDQDFIFLA